MWLLFVETYLFVLVAFAVGVAVGLVGVRLGVRRIAPPRGPKAPKAPQSPAGAAEGEKKKRGRRGKAASPDTADSAAPTEAGVAPAVATGEAS